jgi:DNA-binding NarL/FixJ family response regulator
LPVQILIADDNASVRSAMRRVLEAQQWEIIEAENGNDAVSKAAALKPDVVILDLVMPGLDGLMASREIAALLPGVTILLHTLYASPEVDLKASYVGVRKVVPKSESDVLVSAVQESVESQPSATASISSNSITAMPGTEDKMIFNRRTDDKIRNICGRLFATKDDSDHANILVELRRVLHEQMQHLRARVPEYPMVLERRAHTEVPLSIAAQQNVEQGPTPASNAASIDEQPQKTANRIDPERAAG